MEVPILECQTNKGVDWRRVSKEPLKIQVAWPFECETNPPGFQAKQELLHIKVTFFGENLLKKTAVGMSSFFERNGKSWSG